MLCSGARGTREPHLTIGRTVSKSETTQNIPAFQDLNSHAVDMAVAQPLKFRIDFARNPITGSAA